MQERYLLKRRSIYKKKIQNKIVTKMKIPVKINYLIKNILANNI